MNCIYQKQCSPMIECIGFLEHYVNEESYLHALTTIQQTYSGTFLQEDILTQLDQLRMEVGSWMDQHMPQARAWFTNLQEGAPYSMIKAFVLDVFDPTLVNSVDQIAYMKSQYEAQPLTFLRIVLSLFEEEHHVVEEVTFDGLLKELERKELSDNIKWSIMKFHLTLPQILDDFLILLDGLSPILQTYQTVLDQCLQIYLDDYETYQDELYEVFTKQHELKLQDNKRSLMILPTVAFGYSLIFHESDINPQKSAIVLWGVDVLHTAKNLGMATTSDAICSVLKVLSDKSKFEILCFLSKHKTAYGAEIAKAMNLTTATISYHMQALINAHLIKIEKSNNRLYYSINDAQLKNFLQSVERHILMP